MNPKNAPVAGSGGTERQAAIASLVETCKLNGVHRHSCLADIIADHPPTQLDDLLPWAYAAKQLKAEAQDSSHVEAARTT